MRLFVLSFVAVSSIHAQSVVVVDDDGGPDVDFLSLTEAVTNAPDGALVLVRAGSYQGFQVEAKSLTIAADEGQAVVLTAASTIVDLQPSQSCTLVGLQWDTGIIFPASDLAVTNCAGSVWLEGLTTAASTANPFLNNDTIVVSDSPSVVMTNCFIGSGQGSALSSASAGLGVLNSNVHLYGCEIEGQVPAASGAPGSAAVRVLDGFLFAADSLFTGGTGAVGGNFFSCEDGGDGGPGILLQSPSAQAQLFGTTLVGGAGGTLAGPGSCSIGANGPTSRVLSGTLVENSLTAHRLDVPGPLRSGEPADLTFAGPAGSSAWLLYADSSTTSFFPGLFGSLLLAPPFTILVAGTLDGNGSLTLSIRAPGVPAGAGFRAWQLQSLFLDLSSGFVIGSGAPLIVLR